MGDGRSGQRKALLSIQRYELEYLNPVLVNL